MKELYWSLRSAVEKSRLCLGCEINVLVQWNEYGKVVVGYRVEWEGGVEEAGENEWIEVRVEETEKRWEV